MKDFLEAGKIVGTHGINGNVKVEPWCDSAEFLCSFKTLYFKSGEKKINVISARKQKSNVIMSIEGVDDVEKAIAIRGKILYLKRSEANLPDDTFFVQDIIGCKVFDMDTNDLYGEVTDVFKTGANDVYQIKDKDGKIYLIPVIPDVVKTIDVDNQKIHIRPLEGLLTI